MLIAIGVVIVLALLAMMFLPVHSETISFHTDEDGKTSSTKVVKRFGFGKVDPEKKSSKE